MKYIALLLSALFIQFTIHAQNSETTIKVWGNCGMCKKVIEQSAKADGVVAANWDMAKKELAVVYDASKISSLKVQEQIAAAGYDTEDLYAPDSVYAQLHGCCKYDRKAKTTTDATPADKEAPAKSKQQNRSGAVAPAATNTTLHPVADANGNVFTGAMIQASGLTCALCSNAINDALEQLGFIASIEPDLNTSSFLVTFKPNTTVSFDAMKDAVIDAGFSVASLKVSANFDQPVKVEKDKHFTFHGLNLHFMNDEERELSGEQWIKVIDKNFIATKDFKNFSKTTTFGCYETGVMADCCQISGKKNQRIYHITL